MSLRVLVVDDEPLARQRLRALLEQAEGVEIAGECADGEDAVEAILRLEPDVVFLDVQMPELTGLEVIEAVGEERMPVVVFVTAYDEHALRAFEAGAADYLLKPFPNHRFEAALERARARATWRADERAGDLRAVLAAAAGPGAYRERLVSRVGARIIFIPTAEVDWINQEANYARLHVGPRTYLVRDTMGQLEAKLDPARFLRIHRSTIVALRFLKEVESQPRGGYVCVLADGTRLPCSRRFRDRVDDLIARSS
ncbi:MAG TPA: LytTR family DNA-binding domain-containing protein [Longimicrobium sp.]|nr:LytTR family DNA-binding domain-containing protein [Longimicrobium sp.]